MDSLLIILIILVVISIVLPVFLRKRSGGSDLSAHENKRLKEENDTKAAEIKVLQVDVMTYKEKIAELNTLINHYEDDKKERLSSMEKLVEDVKKTQSENKHIEAENARLTAQLESAVKKMAELNEEVEALKTKNNDLTETVIAIKEESSSFEEKNKNLQEKLETQKKELEEIGLSFTNEFKLLADKILDEKSKKFTEQNQQNLKNILDPLGKNLDEFKKRVEETYDKESKQRFSLEEKIKELAVLNTRISEEAKNLTQALKGSVKKQGDWGEMILERILENSGLTKGREYHVQEFLRDDAGNTIKDTDGRKLQPDVIIQYPDDRKVIIDSKVSLVAYERFSSAETKAEQDMQLVEHIKSIRGHVDNLSNKSYQNFTSSLDFVMLFIPIEPAYMVAVQKDQQLWDYAYKKRILLISPTNLIAALKLIADLWQREYQNRNAIEIAERGGKLYDKFVSFIESLDDIGRNLDRSQKSYSQAMKQLKDGSGNLIGQVEKLRKLGVKAQKNLPEQEIDEADPPDQKPSLFE